MVYEKKRTFSGDVIDLADAALEVDAAVYAGSLALSATEATAGTLDYEFANQHFPEENTLEIIGWETADSAADGATLALTLQSSADGETWVDKMTINLLQADIVLNQLIFRSTIPATMGQHMRLKMVAGTEVFTAGKIFAVVRPL